MGTFETRVMLAMVHSSHAVCVSCHEPSTLCLISMCANFLLRCTTKLLGCIKSFCVVVFTIVSFYDMFTNFLFIFMKDVLYFMKKRASKRLWRLWMNNCYYRTPKKITKAINSSWWNIFVLWTLKTRFQILATIRLSDGSVMTTPYGD